MANTIDISALTASLGDYYRSNGQILSLQVFNDIEDNGGVAVYTGIADEEPMIVPEIGTLLQPGGPEHEWNPTQDAFKFADRMLKVRDWSLDLVIRPKVLQKTFLNRLTPPGSNPYNMDGSFEAMIVEHILKQIKNDLSAAVWRGIYNAAAVAAGAADPFRLIDGFLRIVAADLASGTPILSPVVSGAITNTNAVEVLESVFSSADEQHKKRGGKMYVSPLVKEMYNKDYRTRFGDSNYNNEFGKRFLELSEGRVEIVGQVELAGSQRVIYDPLGVMGIGTDLESDMMNLTFEREKRDIIVFADGKIGAQYAALSVAGKETIYINDQA